MSNQRILSVAIGASFCVGTLLLGGCNQQPEQAPAAAPSAASTAPAPATTSAAPASAYTPPSADQLYQLVAPIALFPDKLVAQVLAGSTYPDQITAADNLLMQSPNLKGTLLQAAVDPQPWDPSVKGLTAFPSTLDQMAKNIQWTTALGEAYVNDPTDVLNAVQVMRQRASAHGNLRSSQQQRVETRVIQTATPDDAAYAEDNGSQPVYSGPSVVPAPQQVIEIEPAQPDTVYVPSYDPQTVYGGDIGYYPSYTYERPSYSGADLVAVGAVAFGAAILIGSMHDHHRDGGDWHSWGMNWGGGRGGNEGGGGGWHRPAVVYNNQTYVSRSTTVVNRYTTNNITNINSNNRTVTNNNGNVVNQHNTINNINNSNNTNNSVNNSHNQIAQNREVANHPDNRSFDHRNVPNGPPAPAPAPGQPNHMTMPNFSQARQPAAAAANNTHPVAPHAAVAQPHEAQPRVDERHAQVPRPQETLHQPTAVNHAPPPQPTQRPHAAPAPHPAMAQPRPAEHVSVPHPQPEPHMQPAPHPQPHQQQAPRPQPESRPEPQHQNPQPHPAPQQNHPQRAAPPHPEKKDDKDHH